MGSGSSPAPPLSSQEINAEHMFQYLECVGNELGHLSFVHSLSCEVPPIPMGDLLKEQVEEMGPHFRYVGNLQKDNEFSFDLSGALMVTGHAASPY